MADSVENKEKEEDILNKPRRGGSLPSIPLDKVPKEKRGKFPPRGPKKKHKKIDKKHPEFELTYDMMLGIRTTVGQSESKPMKELTMDHLSEVTRLRFLAEGTKLTPPHKMRDFKFKDYCPEVFRSIRSLFGIQPEDYIMSVCGNFQYLEFVSNAKSGSFFFYSHDRQYMIKTLTQNESKYLRKILPHYYQHVASNPNTLLCRFYGMHRVKPHKKAEVHFLIMGSVFHTSRYIHETFDLKGALHNRATFKDDNEERMFRHDFPYKNPVMKDLDWIRKSQRILIGPDRAKILRQQLAADTAFLEKLKIMDYSLLIGVHYIDRAVPIDGRLRRSKTQLEYELMMEKATSGGVHTSKSVPSTPAHPLHSIETKRQAPLSPPIAAADPPAVAEVTEAMQPVNDNAAAVQTDEIVIEKAQIAIDMTESNRQKSQDSLHTIDDYSAAVASGDMKVEDLPAIARLESNFPGVPQKYTVFSAADQFNAPPIDPLEKKELKLESLIDDVNLFYTDDGGLQGMVGGQPSDIYYFMGIIDVLTEYGAFKRAENWFKTIRFDASAISCVPPDEYRRRFLEFFDEFID